MAELKTQKNEADVDSFLESVESEQRRSDAKALTQLMEEVTGQPATMWGSSIVGFGTKPITYANGTTSEWMAVGFAPRKANTVLYIMDGFDSYDDLLGELGPHKTGKSCLYVKRLSDVDLDVLTKMIEASYKGA
ncbi:MAG: DUF1801 domain-containing protein [Acidimicrobiales bacterium]